jgi:hypothetical protein
MFVAVTEADAAAVRAAFDQGGEFAAAVEFRRLFLGVADTLASGPCALIIPCLGGTTDRQTLVVLRRAGGVGVAVNPSSRIRGFFGSTPVADQRVGGKGLHYSTGLLSADHAAASPACVGTRTDRAEHSREIRRRPDDRCSSADDRRARAAADPLHPAGARTRAPDPAAQAPIATTATTAHRHRLRPSPPLARGLSQKHDPTNLAVGICAWE